MRRPGWYSLICLALGALVADQVSKFIVERLMAAGSLRVVVPGMLNLVRTSNPGVAFGLGANAAAPWVGPVLILFSLTVIVALGWLLATGRAGGWLGHFGIALILGGAAGNVMDRLLRHSVTDFIDFHLGSYHWYTFNVADSAIVLGAAFVVLELFRDWRHPSHRDPEISTL